MALQTGDLITEDTVFVEADYPLHRVYMSGSGSRWVDERLRGDQCSRVYDGCMGANPYSMNDRSVQSRTMPDWERRVGVCWLLYPVFGTNRLVTLK